MVGPAGDSTSSSDFLDITQSHGCIKLFLVDCLINWLGDGLMCQNVSLIAFNSKPSSCSIDFCLFIS